MKTLNSAIIGLGAIGPLHMAAIESSPYANPYAVCDINPARLASVREGIIRYNDFNNVLSDGAVEVIHICTPHFLHAPMLCAALEAGKNVVLEKPVAINERELEQIITTAEKSAKQVCVMFQNRTNQSVRKMLELAEGDKSLGKLLGAAGFLTWHRDAEYYAQDKWRGRWATEGGGLLINQAVHILDILNLFGGGITSVNTSMSNKSLNGIIEVEDTFDSLLEFENGMTGCLYCTNAYPPSGTFRVELSFENAVLRYADNRLYRIAEKVEIVTCDDTNAPGKSYWGNGHRTVIDDFYKALSCGGEFIGLQSAIRTTRAMLASYESAKQNKKIYLPS